MNFVSEEANTEILTQRLLTRKSAQHALPRNSLGDANCKHAYLSEGSISKQDHYRDQELGDYFVIAMRETALHEGARGGSFRQLYSNRMAVGASL